MSYKNKICLKNPCTSLSASSAVLAVQGLLRQILQGIPFLGKLDRDRRRGNCKVWERRHWESDIQDIPFLVVWLSRERGVTADRVVKDIPQAARDTFHAHEAEHISQRLRDSRVCLLWLARYSCNLVEINIICCVL